MNNNNPQKYHQWSIAMHWLMLLLLVAVYLCIELRVLYPKGSDLREGLKQWHFMLGFSVYILLTLRLIGRFLFTVPEISPTPAKWQMMSAKVVHLLLYLLMLAMPLLGMLILNYADKSLVFFGLQLPVLVSPNEDMAKQIKEIHEWIGTAGYWLVGIHALAALFHHYVIKDNTLKRMLPR